MLSSFNGARRPGCIYWDIENLLPEDLQSSIAPLKPLKGDTKEQKLEVYSEIQKEIRRYFEVHPDDRLSAACAIHGQDRERCVLQQLGKWHDGECVEINNDDGSDDETLNPEKHLTISLWIAHTPPGKAINLAII